MLHFVKIVEFCKDALGLKETEMTTLTVEAISQMYNHYNINSQKSQDPKKLIIDQDLAAEVLGPARGGKYVCPVCNERKFSTSKFGDRGFQCFSCGDTKAIYQFFKEAVGSDDSSERYQPTEKKAPPKPTERYRIDAALLDSSHPKVIEFASKRAIPLELARLNLGYCTNNSELAKFIGWKKTKFTGAIVSKFGDGYSDCNQIRVDNPPKFLGKVNYITPKATPRKLFKPRVPGNYQGLIGNYWERVHDDKTIPLAHTEGVGKTLSNQWNYEEATTGASGVNNALSCSDFDELYKSRDIAILKYDGDWIFNQNVARAMIAVGERWQDLGVLNRLVAVWDASFAKGIDDVIFRCQQEGKSWEYGAGIVSLISFEEWLKDCYRYHPNLKPKQGNRYRNHYKGKTISKDEFIARFGPERIANELSKLISRASYKYQKKLGKLPERVELTAVASADLSLADSAGKPRALATQQLPKCLPPTKDRDYIIEFNGDLPDLKERDDYTVIEIERNQLKEVIKQLHQKTESGCIISLDLPTGTGKSHDFGSLNATDIEADIIYTHSQHRNPTVGTIEDNYEPIGGKHGGLVHDYKRLTENGYPYVRHRRDNEELEDFDTPANCQHFETFKVARDKGINLLGGKGSANCENCNHYKNDEGKVVCSALLGRLELNSNAGDFRKYRTHPVSLPSFAKRNNPSLLIIDESDRELQSLLNKITVEARDIWAAWGTLNEKNPALADIFKPIAEQLKETINNFDNRYGVKLSELKQSIDFKAVLAELIGAGAITPNIDITDITPRALKVIAKAIAKILQPDLHELFKGCHNPEERANRARNHINANWISPLLRAFAGSGSVRVDANGLHFTACNQNLANNIKNADTIIAATATTNLTELAYQLKTSKKRIIRVKLKTPPDCSNLTFKIINGMGIKGNRRDDSDNCATNRLQRLIDKIIGNPSKTYAIIDNKKHLPSHKDKRGVDFGYWHSQDTRGGNRFKCKDALVLIGAPYPNIGETICDYEAQTGRLVSGDYSSDRSFMTWLSRKKDAEIIQGIGRLRANNRSDNLDCWLIDSQISERTLAENFPGCQIEKVNLFEFCLDALPVDRQKEFRVTQALAQFDETITRDKLAHNLGMSTGNISRIAKKLVENLGIASKHAFSTLKQFVTVAIKGLLSESDGELNPDYDWFLRDYFPSLLEEVSQGSSAPLEVIEAVEMAYSQFGPSADKIWGKLPIEQAIQLINLVLGQFVEFDERSPALVT